MGASFIDYIIADQYLIPPNNKKFFSEKPIYLPNTFMPTDNSRKFSSRLIDDGLSIKLLCFAVSTKTIKLLI